MMIMMMTIIILMVMMMMMKSDDDDGRKTYEALKREVSLYPEKDSLRGSCHKKE